MVVDPRDVVLFVGLCIAAATDLHSGRIPNLLTFPMMALGIAMSAVQGEPAVGLLGCAAAFAVHFPLFALGIGKAGDAKLMMGLGALVGWHEMLEATVWLAVLYLPLGIAVLAVRGKLGNLIASAKYAAAKATGKAAGEPPEPTWL